MKWQKKHLQRAPQKHQLYHGLIEVKLTYLFIIILKLMREFLTNYKIRKSYPFPQLSCMSSEKNNSGLNELITYECLGHNWLWAEEFQDVRVSMLSCYFPWYTWHIGFWKINSMEESGRGKKKEETEGFHFELQYSCFEGTTDVYYPHLLKVQSLTNYWKATWLEKYQCE